MLALQDNQLPHTLLSLYCESRSFEPCLFIKAEAIVMLAEAREISVHKAQWVSAPASCHLLIMCPLYLNLCA